MNDKTQGRCTSPHLPCGEASRDGDLKGEVETIDDTTKRTIKNLGEGVIIERTEEMPDQPQDPKSLIQNWAYIKSYISGRIEVID